MRIPLCVPALAVCLLLPGPARGDSAIEAPSYLRLLEHRDIAARPDWRFDGLLQQCVERAVGDLELGDLVRRGEFGVALVDLSDGARSRLAEVNGEQMMYAASVPKLAVLLAAFQAKDEGRLRIDPEFERTLTSMIRQSSNSAASAAIARVGFNYIASVLWQSGLYDPELGGGLWVGKAYGGQNDRWHRDPVANLSHGASPLSLVSLLTLLSQDRLVDADSSRAMKRILSGSQIHHKFVRGLDARPGSQIQRKSGTWRDWHGDAALVERDGKQYTAAALCHHPDGGRILERLIVSLDDCVMAPKTRRTRPVDRSGRASVSDQRRPAHRQSLAR